MCRHNSASVLVPALRTVGNIVTGDDLQTQVIIQSGALGCLLHLLTSSQKKSIKKVISILSIKPGKPKTKDFIAPSSIYYVPIREYIWGVAITRMLDSK